MKKEKLLKEIENFIELAIKKSEADIETYENVAELDFILTYRGICNMTLISEPIRFNTLSGFRNYQIDFTDGSYLMRDEIDDEYCQWTAKPRVVNKLVEEW